MQLSEKISTLLQLYNDYAVNKTRLQEPETVYRPIIYALSIPAKRVRPLACMLAYSIFDKDLSRVLPLAYSFEHFHNFTLVHDDIMDNAPLRRGMDSVFQKYGLNQALLSGDLMLLQCYAMLLNENFEHKNTILKCFTDTAIQVCEGQQMDIDFEKQENVSESDYIQMIQYKTAVLLAACLKCGALAANANEQDAENLYLYGLKIGTIFQIKDDILDVYSNENSGKIKAGDILQHKKTILYILTLQSGNELQIKKLKDYYTSKQIDNNEKINGVVQIFNETNVIEKAELLIHNYQKEADDLLNKISINNSKRKDIKHFAESLLKRMK